MKQDLRSTLGGGGNRVTPVNSGFDKPSRGTSGARGEQESAETSSFRCDCERCRLMRGAVNSQKRGGQAERCHLSRGAVKPSRGQDLYPRPFVGEGARRTGEGSHSDKIAQQVRNDNTNFIAILPKRDEEI